MNPPNRRTIEGPRESFDEQVRAAEQEGFRMVGQPLPTLVGESIHYSAYMVKPTFEQPRRRSGSYWYGRW
jgi:hypothetical protein